MDEWLHAWHKYRLTHACIDGLVTCSVEGASMDHWMSSDGHNQVGWDFQTYDFDLHLYPTVLSGKWKQHTSCSTAVATSTIEASVTSGTRMDGVVHGRSTAEHKWVDWSKDAHSTANCCKTVSKCRRRE